MSLSTYYLEYSRHVARLRRRRRHAYAATSIAAMNRTVKLWNSLDHALKLKPTLADFKRCLKTILISNFLET